MFERFTDRARRLVVRAQEESRQHNHRHIGTEHILLGLLDDAQAVGTRALAELGVDLVALRQRVNQEIGVGAAAPAGHIPFTAQAKKALELSLREALALRHNYIGTEHIMLALLRLRQDGGVAADALSAAGIDPEAARQEVLRIIAEERAAPGMMADHEEIPVAGDTDPAVVDARAAKDAALDRGDFEAAALFRDVEAQLLRRGRPETGPASGAPDGPAPGEPAPGARGPEEPGRPERIDPPA